MKKEIQAANQAVKIAIPKAVSDQFRPKYHFTPPANWMNDPNGTIFHRGNYHLFYQYNPFNDRWGRIHWGHAISNDLVNWQHLPVALAPERRLGERHCFSGCCVIHQDTPTVFYTSMSVRSCATLFSLGSEQWIAVGDDRLISWSKYPHNPIISQDTHNPRKIFNWRDPYIWKQDNEWYMIVAGQHLGEWFGNVFLYRSPNLLEWSYSGRLYKGNPKLGRIWECPNYFPVGDRRVLMVSPYRQVIYSVGDFHQGRHNGDHWHIFDHGKKFYATNTYIDDRGRTIIVGWVKVKGNGGWAGCLSLPRVVELTNNSNITINPIEELRQLRTNHRSIHRRAPSIAGVSRIEPVYGDCIEIRAQYNIKGANYAGFKLLDDRGEYLLTYNYRDNSFTAVRETASMQFDHGKKPLNLQIFIDKSVIEIFINGVECFTTVFHPKLKSINRQLQITPFVSGGQGDFTIDVWELADANIR